MQALNRKQIPVCTEHHKAIHNGTYDGKDLREVLDLFINELIERVEENSKKQKLINLSEKE